jgi:hypothetical protein
MGVALHLNRSSRRNPGFKRSATTAVCEPLFPSLNPWIQRFRHHLSNFRPSIVNCLGAQFRLGILARLLLVSANFRIELKA